MTEIEWNRMLYRCNFNDLLEQCVAAEDAIKIFKEGESNKSWKMTPDASDRIDSLLKNEEDNADRFIELFNFYVKRSKHPYVAMHSAIDILLRKIQLRDLVIDKAPYIFTAKYQDEYCTPYHRLVSVTIDNYHGDSESTIYNTISKLESAGISPRLPHQSCLCAASYSFFFGNAAAIRAFAKKFGTDSINKIGSRDITPIHFQIKEGLASSVYELMKLNADLIEIGSPYPSYPFNNALELLCGHPEIKPDTEKLQILLDSGCFNQNQIERALSLSSNDSYHYFVKSWLMKNKIDSLIADFPSDSAKLRI